MHIFDMSQLVGHEPRIVTCNEKHGQRCSNTIRYQLIESLQGVTEIRVSITLLSVINFPHSLINAHGFPPAVDPL